MADTCSSGSQAVGATVAAALQFFAASQCLLQEPWPPQAHLHNGSSFDFIVVGGGTAGCALAARLAEVPDFTVLLVEAGGNPPQESIIPGFQHAMKGSIYDWNFTSVDDYFASQALSGGNQRQPRGKMLGGSGSLNDMVYSRGFPDDYEEWASTLGNEWNWDNVLEYFKKTEHLTDEAIINDKELMKFHSREGPIEVSGQNHTTYTTLKFLEAFQELGLKIVKDMTNPEVIGAGRFSHTISEGRRQSSLTGILNNASTKKNLFVLKDTFVTKLMLENDTAFGIQALLNGGKFIFLANKEVIVSAGTFNTAKLLLLSGLGPKDHLAAIGIDVVKDIPVGDNLHDHVMVITYLAIENGTCYTKPGELYMDMVKYLYDRTGPLSTSDSMGAHISLNSSNTVYPDFAIYPTCISMGSGFSNGCTNVVGFKSYICDQLDAKNQNFDILSLAIVLLKPNSRGKLRLNSTNPLDSPLIYSGTFSDLSDLNGFPVAIDVAWSLVNTSYFKMKGAHVIDLQIPECSDLKNETKKKCLAKNMATSAWHAVGTAAMGMVVDARLRVRGVRGLRVVDASVMPAIPRGNTNAPVVMIAEKAADFIKEEHGVP